MSFSTLREIDAVRYTAHKHNGFAFLHIELGKWDC